MLHKILAGLNTEHIINDNEKVDYVAYQNKLADQLIKKEILLTALIAENRLNPTFIDKALGIKSTTLIFDEKGNINKDQLPSIPSGYQFIAEYLNFIKTISTPNTRLADIGGGQGRFICSAIAELNIQETIYLDYNREAVAVAKDNIKNLKVTNNSQITKTILQGDASKIDVTADIYYLYKPFFGKTFKEWLKLLEKNLENNPRQIHIIYVQALSKKFLGKIVEKIPPLYKYLEQVSKDKNLIILEQCPWLKFQQNIPGTAGSVWTN